MSFQERWGAFPVLTTRRLVLRESGAEDATEFHRWVSDPEVTQYLSWEGETSLEETQKKLAELRELFYRAFVLPWGITLKGDNRLIGRIRYYQFLGPNWSIGELGYELGKENWNKGIMTEAIQAAVTFGFEQMPGLNRVQATCDRANVASAKALTKAGLKEEGVLRDWGWNRATRAYRDHRMFSILRREYARPEGAPPPFDLQWQKSRS